MFREQEVALHTDPIHCVHSEATCCQLFRKVQISSTGNTGSMVFNIVLNKRKKNNSNTLKSGGGKRTRYGILTCAHSAHV
jgi:hypothetical protein